MFIENTNISDFDTVTNAAGAGGAVYLDDAVALVEGGADSIEFYVGNVGTNALFIDNTAISDFDTITNAAGASGAVYLVDAVAIVQGGADSIEFYAGNVGTNALFIDNTTISDFDTITNAAGAGGAVYLDDAVALVEGARTASSSTGQRWNQRAIYRQYHLK